MKKISPTIQWLVFICAILLPFLVIRFFPEFHHPPDLRAFRAWGEAWKMDWHTVYINCKTCNYPFIGTLLSGGLMSTINYENVARTINRFRYYLAIVDGLNIFIFYFILARLQVRNAPLWAGVLGLLPSSWVSSSVWGQIDGIGQLLILLFFAIFISFNAKPRPRWQTYIYFFVTGFLLSLMLLTKQLIYFSMGALGLILLVNMVRLSRNTSNFFLYALTSAAAFLLPALVVDLNLKINPPYVSHLQYVLATGSQHGDKIASLGFNIWVFYTKDLLGSSHIPLQIGDLSFAPLTPFSGGYILFGILVVFLFSLFIINIRLQNTETQAFNTQQIATAFVFFSFINLAFNLTLTGTHERYLYYFYPFIIIACLALMPYSRFFNKITLTVLLSGALIYGVYLFVYLSGMVRVVDYLPIRIIATFHLGIFIYLLYLWIWNSIAQFSDTSLS